MKKELPLQQMLDTQGYIIIGSTISHKIGDVVVDLIGDGREYENFYGKVVIVDGSTKEEFSQQYLRFFGKEMKIFSCWHHFYKVIAE
jgi:hypothetical protein